MNGSVIGWVVLTVGVWCALALAVGIVVGRVIRLRERQVPCRADLRIPSPRPAPDHLPTPDSVPARDPRGDPGLRGR